MATKQAYTVKDRIYNGTHGNLSTKQGIAKGFAAAANDKLEIFHLGIGVRLIQAKLFVKDAFTAGEVSVKLLNAKDDTVIATVIVDTEIKAAGVIDSDTSVYFPTMPDPQVETKVVIVTKTTVTGKKNLAYEIVTQSVGAS